MRKKTRKLLQVLLGLVLLISLGMLVRQASDNSAGSDSQSRALALAQASPVRATESAAEEKPVSRWIPEQVEEDPYAEEMEKINLAALQEVNPDVIGWIRIPDSNIDYPLVQGEDNDYYLKNTWDGKKSSVGSIFMECRNTPDFMDYNTILYGHNMNDGSMFANIKRYASQWYWEKHPYVYLLTEKGVYRYEVFAAYETPVDSRTYGLSFHQVETKTAFLEHAFEKSPDFYDLFPDPMDRILTLSTCSGMGYSNRWVIHARLKLVLTQTEA